MFAAIVSHSPQAIGGSLDSQIRAEQVALGAFKHANPSAETVDAHCVESMDGYECVVTTQDGGRFAVAVIRLETGEFAAYVSQVPI